MDPILNHLFHFFLLDLKNAEKDSKASARLISSLENAIFPSSYLSSAYFTVEQQQLLLSHQVSLINENGDHKTTTKTTTLKQAFEERFIKSSKGAPCGPHEVAPWYMHMLGLTPPTSKIKSKYKLWATGKTKKNFFFDFRTIY